MFNVFLIFFPTEALAAAREGLLLWFNNVLPSLLPFIVGINILRGAGAVRFIGEILSPVMRPVFNVSGAGGFALITGLTSGYPMGAKTVAELRRENSISQAEAQRLMAFCNNAGPVFILGVAGTGLFGSAEAGYRLWFSHVAAALCVGLIMRFYKKEAVKSRVSGENVLNNAVEEFRKFRRKNDCSIGRVLGDGMMDAIRSVTAVGGFIILFCVLVKALEVTGAINAGRDADGGLLKGILTGLLEMTNGIKILAQPTVSRGLARAAVTPAKLSCAAAVITFGGFSIHAQTLHFIRGTDIKTAPYLICKLTGAVLAGGICWLTCITTI
ncbi:MAG: hypothetical protein LBR83_10510 [Clostridiales bacterium]|nr:hypothetical protein [Clostridiales bacterium]